MIGNANKNFADVVATGEMIENRVKLGKIKNTEAKKPIFKRKERETHAVSYQKKAYNPSYPQQQNHAHQPYNQYARNNGQGNYQPNYKLVTRFPTLSTPHIWQLLSR